VNGKVVVITGAGNGIGAALARRYGASGARLALLDIDEAAAAITAEACVRDGAQARSWACDVTDLARCETVIAEVMKHFGAIDCLIANAGITHLSPFEETDVSVIRRVMEVNFYGAVNMAKACLPHLLAARGQIVVMSSVAGFCPLPMRTGYSASKYAVRGFFETLRAENRHKGLRVLVVCPSFVDTGIGTRALGGDGAAATRGRPEAKGATPTAEVADAVFRAAMAGRDFLAVARGARLSYFLSRLAPGLLERLSIRRVFSQQNVSAKQ
jgi:NAD(P)-dependent dehydrogenase (short-subunit alcohol dehydrogenase family)